jgi:hypothetical protein
MGLRAKVKLLNESVLPLMTGTDAVSAQLCRKLPDVLASQIETCEMVSDVVIENDDSDDSAIDPADAADQAMAFRVVTAEALLVPAEPGSPVWSFTNGVAIAGEAVLRYVFR